MRGNSILKACCLAAVALFHLTAGLARADGLAEPKVEYSADQYMGSGGRVTEARVYHAPGKQRMDLGAAESAQSIITRMDRKVTWVVVPDQKMYMEMSLEEGRRKNRDITNCSFSQKTVGKESVNGIAATKSEFEASCPDKSAYGGFLWISKEGILVKMDAVAKGKESKDRFTLELKNLKIGRLDPKLFEVPPGYQAMQMPFGGRMPRAVESGRDAERDPPETSRPEDPPKEKGTVEKTVEPMKKIKGLFGW